MPYKDPVKAKESQAQRSKRYRARKHAERFGENAGNMSGRHGHHARGKNSGKWAGSKLTTSHGYIAVRVPVDHPHAWGPPGLSDYRYAYEHIVKMMTRLGRPLNENEVVHHKNGDKSDNRIRNLEVLTKSSHAAEHSSRPGVRNSKGQFNNEKRH